jgi:hypothetical protein
MLENQISSESNNHFVYEIMDTNLPAIEKLTGATSVNTYKYWNPATNESELKINKGEIN